MQMAQESIAFLSAIFKIRIRQFALPILIYKSLIANLQPNQTLPVFIHLNSSDATSVDKIVKIYIDANNDGDFSDAGEELVTSGVVNGDGNFTLNITVPQALLRANTLFCVL